MDTGISVGAAAALGPQVTDGCTSHAGVDSAVQGTPSADGAKHRKRGNEQLEVALRNAEYLLNYAVEAGIEVETETAQRIIAARCLGNVVWETPDAGAVVAAITKLAAKLHPVTAETLRACREEAHDTIRGYKHIVYWLAAFIIPLSMISFISTGISNTITTDLKNANELAVTLHAQLDAATTADSSSVPPKGALSELQQFAAMMRDIHSRTRQLSWFLPLAQPDPFATKEESGKLELPANLKVTFSALQSEANDKTGVYQEVRQYATNVQDGVSVIWGAIGTCILPVLYALLGACAYVLRAFTEQTEARTFAPSYATPARFVIAAIGGGVVGLFNNFTIGQGSSLSPLAVAFLIGYAADIFFSFLEGSMQNLNKAKPRRDGSG